MKVHKLSELGFKPATEDALSYFKSLSGFDNKHKLKIEWNGIQSGILVHEKNPSLFIIFKDKPEKEFVLAFAMTRGLRCMVTVKVTNPSMTDSDFEDHIVSEYVKKHINDKTD